jgi:hypothetical protein
MRKFNKGRRTGFRVSNEIFAGYLNHWTRQGWLIGDFGPFWLVNGDRVERCIGGTPLNGRYELAFSRTVRKARWVSGSPTKASIIRSS